MTKRSFTVALLSSLLMSITPGAFAQDIEPEYIPEITDTLVSSDHTGWHPRLRFNGNFSMAHSKNVPGSTEGTAMLFGALLNGTVDYLSPNESHEWTNALLWDLGYSKTPTIEPWIKSLDRLEYKTAYLYHFQRVRWLGPFFAFRVTTAMLPSYEVRADPVTAVRVAPGQTVSADGAGLPVDEAGNRVPFTNHGAEAKIDLTKRFAPTTLRETLGMFAKPLTKPTLQLDARLGIGAWETFVRNGVVLDDNGETPFLELVELEDSWQIGAELGAVLSGDLKEGLLNYSVSALFMQPFAHSESKGTDDLNGIELMNVEFEAALGVKLTKYLSINYGFKALKQSLIVDKWQVQNNLLISIGFDLVGNPPPEAMETPCDCTDAVNAAKAQWDLAHPASQESDAAAPGDAETTSVKAAAVPAGETPEDEASAPEAEATAPEAEATADATEVDTTVTDTAESPQTE
ncbi:MAG: hypothetical protein JXX14_19165 [Deltaproteobacteria bacterium]|nr:hypothetical protein [Deltaproteobacteria bacterium]